MSKLFIYYSFSGNGDAVAAKMAEKGFELRRVETPFKLSDKLFPQMMKGGFSAAISQKPALTNYDSDVSGFDEVCIGAPIWNGRFASPVNTVLRDTDLSGKKLTFVLCSGSGGAKNASAKVAKLYPDAAVIHLRQPKDNADELAKLDALG
ncbi:MAG: hypothetical protein ILO53_08730 [Clostridia bacterium]|nr:hypothetical protein [Clostridia bacterium]